MKKIILFFFLMICIVVQAQDGKLLTQYVPQNIFNSIAAVARLSDGSLIVGGTANNGQLDVVKLNSNGQLVGSFNATFFDNLYLTSSIRYIYVHSDGSIYVGGRFSTDNVNYKSVIKLTSTGAYVPSFAVNLPKYFLTTKIMLQPGSNKLLICGGASDPATVHRGIYRLNSNGSFDTTFNPGQQGVLGTVNLIVADMEVYANGDIIIGGFFNYYNDTPRENFAKLNANGSLQSVDLITNSWNIEGLAIQPDGKMLMVGVDDNSNPLIRRYNTNLTIDSSFQFTGTSGYYRYIQLQDDGKIITGGNLTNIGKNDITRLNNNGSFDNCFDTTIATGNGSYSINDVIIEPDGNIIAWGSFPSYDNVARPGLAKVRGKTTIAATSENGNAVPGTTGGISVQNVLANDLLNGAPATTSNVYLGQISTQHPNITLNSDTGAISVAPNTPPGLYLLTYQICEQDLGCYCSVTTDKITVGGPIVANNDTYSLNAGETTASVFNNDTLNGSSFAWSQVGVTLFDAGGIGATINYLGQITVPFGIAPGTYTLQYSICQVPGNLNCDPATVTVTVTPTLTTGIRANNDVQFIDKQSSGKTVIGGRFNFYNNTPARNMIRLNNDLSLDTSFQVQSGGFSRQGNYLESSLESLKVLDDDSVIVTGKFNDFNGQTVSEGIAKFNPDGDLDTYFNAGGSGAYLPVQGSSDGNGAQINDVVVLPDGYMVAIGNFTSYNGYESHEIVGLKPDGSFNPDFYTGSGFSFYGSGPSLIRLHQEKLLIVGDMYDYQGGYNKSIMRIDLNGNVDPTFHQSGAGFYSNPLFVAFDAVAIQPDDKILIGGAFISIDGYPSKNLVRLLPNGEIDPNFNIGTGFTHPNSDGRVFSISLQDDGKIVVGGKFTSYNGYPVKNIVRIDEYGNYDPSFTVGDGPQPEMNNIAYIWALYTQADGKIIIGGRFANFDNIYAGNITRIIPEYGVQGRPGAATDIFEEAAQGVTLYPNPSNGIFNLQVDGYDGEAFELEVYNTLGQLVLKSNLSGQSVYQIDLSSVETGNYFVRMQNNNTVINKIIAVKK